MDVTHIALAKFIICAGLILFVGRKVARYADVIAEKTGLSHLWVGVILVAAATSLPELFTGVGSVVFLDAPNLTIGNLMGANSYNLLNIAFLDLLHRGGPILSAVSSGQLLTAVLSLIPVMLAVMGILLRGHETFPWVIGNVGIFTIAIFISYCVAARIIYKHEKNALKKSLKGDKKETKYDAITLKKACFYFVASAAVIIVTGVWLAYIGEELSVIFSLNESFVGSLFLGFVTTLPEITVSVAALLMGFREIAIANMLGSNLFNMTIIFVDDILYKKAPILKAVSPGHVTSALVVMAMTAVVILAMVTGKGKKILRISWYVPVLFIIFLLGAYLNFIAR